MATSLNFNSAIYKISTFFLMDMYKFYLNVSTKIDHPTAHMKYYMYLSAVSQSQQKNMIMR